MKKQTKCKRKNCHWYVKKFKNNCCVPFGGFDKCKESNFRRHFINFEKDEKYRLNRILKK